MSAIDGAEMEALACKLWGEPNRALSSRTELRFGRNGSKSLKLGECVFFDHETGKGGGFRDLYKLVHGRYPPNGEALKTATPKRRMVATYPYQDANGELLFEVVRYDPKDFRQRRPDGRGGYIWNLQGIDPVPYCLPELLAAALDAVVFVPEGEKDVEALRRLGLVATCNPGGAGKWPESFARYFAGRKTVLLSDNDAPGEAHVQDVTAKLKRVAESVRVVRLPGLSHKQDVSDWLTKGGTAEQLLELVAKAEEAALEPEVDPWQEPGFLTLGWWLERKLEKPENLLGNVVTNSARIFLFGQTGLGRTHLALAMAAGMATGSGFAHWESTRPCRVLFVDGEMSRDLVLERLADVARRERDAEPLQQLQDNLTVICMEDFPEAAPFNTDAGRAFILDVIARLGGVDVVFLDNRMSLTVGSMAEEQPWSDTLPLVSELTRRRIAQIWIDHAGHDASRGYGTKTKEWRFDAVMVLTQVERPEVDIAFKLEFTKARRRRPENRTDFDPVTLTLVNDQWSVEVAATPIRDKRDGTTGRPLSNNSRVALDRLNNVVAGAGIPVPSGPDFPSSPVRGVNVETWRAAFYDAIPDVPSNQRRAYFRRAVQDLTAAKRVGTHKEWVWPVHDQGGGTTGITGTFVPPCSVSRSGEAGTERNTPPLGVSRLFRVPPGDGEVGGSAVDSTNRSTRQ